MDSQQPPRKRTRSAAIVWVIVAVVLVAGLIIGIATYTTPFTGTTPQTTTVTAVSTTTSISTSTFPGRASIHISSAAASASNPSLGLTLRLAISVSATGALVVTENDTNTQNNPNNVTAAADWAIMPGATGTDPCGSIDGFPIDYAIASGDYGPNNYTSAVPLTMWSTVVPIFCPRSQQYAYFLFSPLSDNTSSVRVSGNDSETGYWTGQASTAVFHPFPPGSYTVIGEDEWGDLLFLHFSVIIE